VGARFSAPV